MKKIILTKRKKVLLHNFLLLFATISGTIISFIIVKGKGIPYLIKSVILGSTISAIYLFLHVLFRRLLM